MRTLIIFYLCCLTIIINAQQPELTIQLGHSKLIYDVAYSPNGKYIASASADRTVKIWETGKGRELRTIYIDIGYATTVQFSHDSKYLLIGGGDYDTGLLKMYDISSGEVQQDFIGHQEYAWKAGFSKDNKYIYSVSFDETVKKWDVESGKVLYSTEALGSLGRGYALDPQGEWIASTHDDDSIGITLWNSDDLSFHSRLNLPYLFEPRSVTFSMDGQYIIVGNYTNDIAIYERDELHPVNFFKAHDDFIMDLIPGKTPWIFYSCAQDKMIHQWDIKTGNLLRTFKGHKDRVYGIDLHPYEDRLISGGSFDKSVLEWDVSNTNIIKQYKGNIYPVSTLKLSNDGKKLMINSKDDYGGDVYVWHLDRLNKVQNMGNIHENYHFMDANDTALVIAGTSGNLQLRQIDNGKLLHEHYFQNLTKNPQLHPTRSTILLNQIVQHGDDWSSRYEDLYEWNVNTSQLEKFGPEIERLPGNQSIYYNQDGSSYYLAESKWKHALIRKYDAISNSLEFEIEDTNSFSLQYEITPDESQLLLIEQSEIKIYDLQKQEWKNSVDGFPSGSINDVQFINSDSVLICGGTWSSGFISLISLEKRQVLWQKADFNTAQNAIAFDRSRQLFYVGSEEGKISIYDFKHKELLMMLFPFANENNEWAAIHPSGLFDGSKKGIEENLYFTYLLEPIELFQLKERYYEPGLLQKVLGFNSEPIRKVNELTEVQLYPKAHLSIEDELLNIRLLPRTGGVGKIKFYVNGKEMLADISNRFLRSNTSQLKDNSTSIDLSAYEKYMSYDESNLLSIVTTNIGESMTSPVYSVRYLPKPSEGFTDFRHQPRLFALVVGTSDYQGEQLDLNFASKDASDFANALKIGGSNLFGEQNIDIQLLNSNQKASEWPTKVNIFNALKEIATKARPEDVLVMYFSGHGITFGEQNIDFHYLTKDLSSGDISDPYIRENYTISSNDLTGWLNSIAAKKQILVMDACASGQVVEDLLSISKNVKSTQIKALDKMKDRTGLYIIAGSAANKVSYEASQYGQSLLTYSLLHNLNLIGLKHESNLVDLIEWINSSKEMVPELARDIGGIQEPVVALPRNLNSFHIASINEESIVPLPSLKPVFIRSALMELDEHQDVLYIGEQLDKIFAKNSSQGKNASIIFVDIPSFPTAYSIKGIYDYNGIDKVSMNFTLRKGLLKLATVKVEGEPKNILDKMVDEIWKWVE